MPAIPSCRPLTADAFLASAQQAAPKPSPFSPTDNWYTDTRLGLTRPDSGWERLDPPLASGMSIDQLIERAKAENWTSIAYAELDTRGTMKLVVMRFEGDKVFRADDNQTFRPLENAHNLPDFWFDSARVWVQYLDRREKQAGNREVLLATLERVRQDRLDLSGQIDLLEKDLAALKDAHAKAAEKRPEKALLDKLSQGAVLDAIRVLKQKRGDLDKTLQDLVAKPEILVKRGAGSRVENAVVPSGSSGDAPDAAEEAREPIVNDVTPVPVSKDPLNAGAADAMINRPSVKGRDRTRNRPLSLENKAREPLNFDVSANSKEPGFKAFAESSDWPPAARGWMSKALDVFRSDPNKSVTGLDRRQVDSGEHEVDPYGFDDENPTARKAADATELPVWVAPVADTPPPMPYEPDESDDVSGDLVRRPKQRPDRG